MYFSTNLRLGTEFLFVLNASLKYVIPGEENSSGVTSINAIVLYSKHEWQKSSQSEEACFRFFGYNNILGLSWL